MNTLFSSISWGFSIWLFCIWEIYWLFYFIFYFFIFFRTLLGELVEQDKGVILNKFVEGYTKVRYKISQNYIPIPSDIIWLYYTIILVIEDKQKNCR